MDLPVAATQFFHASALIVLAVTLLISTVAFVVMRLYVRAVLRATQRGASTNESSLAEADRSRSVLLESGPFEIQVERPAKPSTFPARSATFQHAEKAFRRAAASYVLGGSVHAASSVCLLVLFGVYSLPSTPSGLTIVAYYAAVFWAWSFFTLVALLLLRGPDSHFRWLLILGYVAMLPALGALLELAGAPALPLVDVGSMPEGEADFVLSAVSKVMGRAVAADWVSFSPYTQPIVFWSLAGAPLIFSVLAFNRFIRATVGPLFINLALATTLGCFVILDFILWAPPGVWLVAHIKRISGDSALAVLMIICLTLAAAFAWVALMWTAHRYRRMLLSDQTFLLDALWLMVSFFVATRLMGDDYPFRYLLGAVPFVLYKLTVRNGLRPIVTSAEGLPAARLLFLRVFGSARRSERLFDLLAARWRYAGSIQIISASDMARSRFEPDEFLDFLGGRMGDSFVDSGTDLDQRLAGLTPRRDPDGRYRVNEFFCRINTWKQTVTRLMAEGELVVMDLRAFTAERKGCIFQLGALIDEVPLSRVVLLIDKTTDEPFLRRTLADLWRSMHPRSPNSNDRSAKVRVIDLAGDYAGTVRRLMQLADEALA